MDNKDNIKIGSVKTFLEKIDKLQDDKCILLYRGHFSKSYELKPSIYRTKKLIENEDKIYKEIISILPDEFNNTKFTIEKLIKMQHYSVPTRLLDLSKNPLVALFFACFDEVEKNDNDGEVIVCKIPGDKIKYFDSDTVSVISNIVKRPCTFKFDNSICKDIKTFNNNLQIQYLLHEIKEDKPYFEPFIKHEHINSIICVRPRLNNQRIIRQDGYFLLFGINYEKIKPAIIPEDWYVHENKERIIINKDKKVKLLQQLDLLNVNRKTLFPEFENIAKYVKEKYK